MTVDSILATKENCLPETNPPPKEQGVTFGPLSLLVEDVPDEPDWLWDGYLAPGTLTLLGGKPKAGKSTALFALLAAMGEGGSFLGRSCRQTRSLVLTEEGLQTLKEKVVRWNLGDSVHGATHRQIGGLDWPVVIEAATNHCQRAGIGVLVIDTLAAWAGLGGESENDPGPVLERLRPLLAAAGTGLAVLIIAHQRKSGGEHGDAIRGSNALAGTVDVILELERPAGFAEPNHRVLRAVSRFESTPTEIHLSLDDDGYRVIGDAAMAKSEHERVLVLDALTRIGSGSAADVAEESGIPRRSTSRHLDALFGDDTIGRDGNGRRGSPYMFSFPASPSSKWPVSNPLFEEAAV